ARSPAAAPDDGRPPRVLRLGPRTGDALGRDPSDPCRGCWNPNEEDQEGRMNAQMEAHMNEEERQSAQQAGEPSESGLAAQPLTCHLCQRPAVLEVHTTGHTVYGLDACREPTDSGVWVCGSCHRALHRWMDRNPGEEAAM